MCAYKPPTVKIGDLRGIAKVTFSTNHDKAKVEFSDAAVWGKPIIMDAGGLPSNLDASGEYFVTVNSDKTQVKNWRPANALVKAVVQKFVAKKDSLPTPVTNPQYGNRYFQIVFEIVEPEQYKGCTITNTYQYFFTEVYDDVAKKSVLGIEEHPKSKYMKPLLDLLAYTGVWDKGSIAYSDNVLPTLERRMKGAKKVVMFAIKNGWIDSDTFAPADEKTPQEEPDVESSEESTTEDESELRWE